jgi:hypothetical protein
MRIVFISIFLFLGAQLFAQCDGFPLWLQGTWEISSPEGSSFEEWRIDGDTLKGRTYRMFGADTLVFENMKIHCYNKQTTYFMNASMNNVRVWAGFLPIQITNNVWLWQNDVTEFPHTISYNKIDDNTISVWFKSKDSDQGCVDFIMTKKIP